MFRRIIAVISLVLSTHATAQTHDLVLIGQGQMSWLMFDIYQAELYAEQPVYRENTYPLALTLNYQRNIKQSELLDTTASEWRRLNIPYQAEWVEQLANLWPNIKKGDQLTFRAESADRGSFYFNNAYLGAIEDRQFAEYFLAIWLSPNSRDMGLRQQLIGGGNV